MNGREEDPLYAIAAGPRVLRQSSQILRVARVHASEIFRKRPRYHQPLGMQVHEMFAGRRRLRIGHEIHVDPRVHFQTGAMRALDHQLEGIE